MKTIVEKYENDLREYNRELNQSGINVNSVNKRLEQYEAQIKYLTKQNE